MAGGYYIFLLLSQLLFKQTYCCQSLRCCFQLFFDSASIWRDVTWRDVTWRDVTWRDLTWLDSHRPDWMWLKVTRKFLIFIWFYWKSFQDQHLHDSTKANFTNLSDTHCFTVSKPTKFHFNFYRKTKNLQNFQSFSASFVNAESRDQPRGGREPAPDHGRKSSDPEVTEAGQGSAAISLARGAEEVSKRITTS